MSSYTMRVQTLDSHANRLGLRSRVVLFLFYTRYDVIYDLLQYTHTVVKYYTDITQWCEDMDFIIETIFYE